MRFPLLKQLNNIKSSVPLCKCSNNGNAFIHPKEHNNIVRRESWAAFYVGNFTGLMFTAFAYLVYTY
jgi:hypothetical protein